MFNFLNIGRIQWVSIIGSILFLFFIIELIRGKKIREAYSILWLFMGAVFMFFSIWRNGLEHLARFLGVSYTPAALFLIMFISVVLILIQYSVVVSIQTEKIKDISQELGLLRAQVKKMQNSLSKK